ncbi:protein DETOXIFICATION 16-like [Gossypium australe]|uniref:Protein DETOXIFICATION n=1 Tax=Gossypium australe TaxID=47621 RepID=A0A5B6W453_9ROSI|nr:protein DETOXIFICATION 16-like [Gossypium australe]
MENQNLNNPIIFFSVIQKKMEREEDKKSSLTSALIQIPPENEAGSSNGIKEVRRKKIIWEEVKKQVWLAGPLIGVSLFQYSIQMISVMLVGHLGELPLSAASMATSFATVTGFSLLVSMSLIYIHILFGNGNGTGYPLRAVIWGKAIFNAGYSHAKSNAYSCNRQHTPCHYMDKHYTHSTFFGQDHDISMAAGEYACFMVPSLFAYGLLQCLVKFLQTQNIVFPMMISSGITTLLHILICWVMVFKSELGFRGAALGNSISNWFNVMLLVLYVKLSPSCAKTWTGFSKEAFHNIFTFLRLAVPSAIMVCLEMWSFEMMVLLSGLLPNPKLQTSVLSSCHNTSYTVWMIPFGLSGAVSTRVSNELGAGNPEAARLAVNVVIVVAICVGLSVRLILIRSIWGHAYSNEVEVVKYVAVMMPLVATSNFLDSLQCVLSVGIPCAVLFAFVLYVGGKGLWLELICALAAQATGLSIVTIRTNWEKEYYLGFHCEGNMTPKQTVPLWPASWLWEISKANGIQSKAFKD